MATCNVVCIYIFCLPERRNELGSHAHVSRCWMTTCAGNHMHLVEGVTIRYLRCSPAAHGHQEVELSQLWGMSEKPRIRIHLARGD